MAGLAWFQLCSAVGLLGLTMWLARDAWRDWSIAHSVPHWSAVSEQAVGALIAAGLRLVDALLLTVIGYVMVTHDTSVHAGVIGRIIIIFITWIELAKIVADRHMSVAVAASLVTHPEQMIVGKVLESLPDAVIVIDRDGIMRVVNAQSELMFGYPRQELIGKAIEKLLNDKATAAGGFARAVAIRAFEKTLKKMEPAMFSSLIENTCGKQAQEVIIPSMTKAPENITDLEEAAQAYKDFIGS